ncbi:MAG: glycosyltransferase, partial [Ruminococcus flavefaciens]|nr:glycosyltransferase [Ruminococcus flavefaciens]
DHADIKFVAISKWEEKCASASMALREKKIVQISNPLDIHIFRPLERDQIRIKYKVEDKKVILFGADKALENPMKGFQYLVEALRYLEGENYQVVCFGEAPKDKQIVSARIPVKYLGTIRKEETLAEWYNAADVFVSPTLQEGFGYTVCEALACGTPAATFAVGGLLDQIVQKENGYLARLYDVKDLAEGIMYCIEHRERLGTAARERVMSHNSYRVIGKQYCKLLEEVVSESGRNVYDSSK